MKNILFIVLDSISNDQIFNSINSKEKAPFLSKLREKCITGDNMYSQAPYTEAALMSLLGSLDTLDDGGYMEKFKNKKTVIDVFNENGYNTFFPTYYPSIYPSYMYYGAKEINYIEMFDFSHVWSYRFKHFRDFYLNGETTKEENLLLCNMLEDNFKAWIEMLKLLEKCDPKTKIMNECINRKDIDKTIIQVSNELNIFQKDKTKYLKKLFEEAENHILFKIEPHRYIDKVNDDDFRKWLKGNYLDTFKRIKKVQMKLNLRNAKFPFKKLLKNINNKQIVKGLLAGYKNLINDKDIMDRIGPNYDLFKAQKSFRSVADLTLEWIEKNKNNKEPWMAYVHVDDAHYTESFFSYDVTDKNIIREEFSNINRFIDKLPKNYCGTIASDLSILYCDSIIEMIFNRLEKNNLLDNTDVVITADHGFSYYFNPIREKYVISSYKENYNVPFLIYGKNIKHKKIKGFLATKDIPVTLLDLAGIKKPPCFKGESLLKFEGRDYSTLEYMGGGCPDMKRRPMVLGIRTKEKEVITEAFNGEITIKEIYNVKKDINEHINLVNSKNINVEKEIKIIENRYKELLDDRR